MFHFIIVNWFDQSSVWVWNRFKFWFNWKLWRVNHNLTIINGMMIKSPYDSWNHRPDFWTRGPVFEGICWRLAVSLSWFLSQIITIKGVELICLYYKTSWEKCRVRYDAGISLVSNPSAFSENNLLSNAEIYNNYLSSCCIIFGRKWRTKMMRAMTWSGKCIWGYNHFYITIESMNISPCVDRANFPFLLRDMMRYMILVVINDLI